MEDQTHDKYSKARADFGLAMMHGMAKKTTGTRGTLDKECDRR